MRARIVFQFRRVVVELEAQFLRFHHDVAAAGQIADQHAAGIADAVRIDVLVTARELSARRSRAAAFVRERGGADPGLARVVADIGDLIHELRKFLELGQAKLAGTQRLLHLQRERSG